MFKIEYEIKLNESGRPYIDLSKDYEDKAEDKFLALELTRFLLQNAYERRGVEFDKYASSKLRDCITILAQVSDEVAAILYEQMKMMGEISLNINENYHIQVNNIEERNELNYNNIIYNNKIYTRQIGLKVFVVSETKVYELINGIDNENWTEANEL
jgi:hypothetical protein